MESHTFEVGPDEKSARLDQYLASVFPKPVSRSHLKKLIDAGNILVNGKPAKPHHKVKPGERIEVRAEEPARRSNPEAEDIALEILYEDDDMIVINKQPGIAVHPGAGRLSGTIVNALLNHCRKLSDVDPARPGIVHRLDKDTSGVMVAAKNNASHAELARQFRDRTVKKYYLALVKGAVELDNGAIDLPIGRHQSNRQKMAVRYDSERKAVTEYKVIKRFDGFTLVMLNLKTGRTHQIRVHMAYIGHPVLGDEKYGSRDRPALNGGTGLSRQALHSYYLKLRHPASGKEMEFTAGLPDDMKAIIGESLGEIFLDK